MRRANPASSVDAISNDMNELKEMHSDEFKSNKEFDQCCEMVGKIKFNLLQRNHREIRKCRRCEPDKYGLYISTFDTYRLGFL